MRSGSFLILLALLAAPASHAALFEASHGSPTMVFAVEAVTTTTSPARSDFDRWTVTVAVRNDGTEPAVPMGFSAYLEAPAQILPSLEHQDTMPFELPVRASVAPGETRTVDFVADVAHGAQVKQFSLGQRFGCVDDEDWRERVRAAFTTLPDGEARWARFQERATNSLNFQDPLTCANLNQPICLDRALTPLPADDESLSWTVEWFNSSWPSPSFVYKVQGAVGARYAAFAGPDTDVWLQTLMEEGWNYLDCEVQGGHSFDIRQGVPGGPDCREQVTTFHLVYMDLDGNVTVQTKSIEPPRALDCVVPTEEDSVVDDRGLPGPEPFLLALALAIVVWRRR